MGWLLLLCLMLGIVTTYAVAWAAANRYRWMDPLSRPIDILSPFGTGWFTTAETGFGVVCCGSLVIGKADKGVQWNGDAAIGPPSWSMVTKGSPAEMIGGSVTGLGSLLERASGWPRLAVVERTVSPGFTPAPVAGRDLTVRVGRHTDPLRDVMLAFMPLWPGFAVDVAVYGAVWVVLLGLVAAARRSRRAKAGMCPICRYDIRGLSGGVCPECGTSLNRSVSASKA